MMGKLTSEEDREEVNQKKMDVTATKISGETTNEEETKQGLFPQTTQALRGLSCDPLAALS